MPSVKTKFQSHKYKIQGNYTKTLDKGLKALVRLAARAWLKEVITHIPIWSGETMGSLKFAPGTNGNLARFLNLAIPINPPHPRRDKTPETGGEQAKYSFTAAKARYSFFYRSDVPAFFYNEANISVSPRSPWQALEAGRISFESYIAKNIDKFKPKLKSLIVREVLRVN